MQATEAKLTEQPALIETESQVSRRSLLGVGAVTAGILGAGMSPASGSAKTLVKSEIRFLTTARGRIAYRIDGAKKGQPPLLLSHRFRATIDDWDPLFIEVLGKQRQVIRFDSAGVGRSGGDPVSTIEEMAAVANDLIAGLGLQKVDLLGWSMGGFVVQELALAAPAKVRRLIIAGAGPGGTPEGPQTDPRYVALATKPVNIDEDFLALFFPDSDEGRAAGHAYLARLKHQKNIGPLATMAAVQAQGMAMAKWRGARDRLSQLTLPVLVANGVHDVLMAPYGTYVIAHEAPNAKAVLYPKAGHAFLFQDAQAFGAEVHSFLS